MRAGLPHDLSSEALTTVSALRRTAKEEAFPAPSAFGRTAKGGAFLLAAAALLPAASATGGYTLVDSDEPGGPAFAWVDIGATGTAVPFGSIDDAQVTLPLPFSFTWFGIAYGSVSVCTNGFLQFGGTSIGAMNGDIPSTAPPNNIAAVFWDDLVLLSGFTVKYETLGTSPSRRFVVSWIDVSDIATGTASYTFQAILYETSGAIRFQYLTMTGPGATGSSSTVGVENLAGDTGLPYLRDGAPAGNTTHDSLAVEFTPNPGGPSPSPAPEPGGSNPTCTVGAFLGGAPGPALVALALAAVLALLRR